MSIKILKELGDNRYEVEIPPSDKGSYQETHFNVVHDYMEFCDWDYAQKENGASSTIKYWSRMTIPIRDFVKFILPRILSNKYVQDEHFKDRVHDEDDRYWANYKLDGPRYKKGDKYPCYAFDNSVIKYWEGGERKIAVRLEGEVGYNIMTPKMFALIKDKIGKEL